MRHFGFWILISALLASTVGLLPLKAVSARPEQIPSYATSFDLIVAVNDLRASYGLPAYNVSDILMGTAQAQADFMASTGSVTHLGPGGISLTQRLINAGYVMEGGFRAENILSISADASGYDVVHSGYWADSDHQNTMLSPNLTEIGAGVAVNGGSGYYVIDCARPSGAPASASSGAGGSGNPATADTSQILMAVVTSTPRADGAIYHEVKYGQSLWSLAIAYGTKIDEIKRLNNLTSNDIYLGQKLLIGNVGTATPASPTETNTPTLPAVQPATTIAPTVTITQSVALTEVADSTESRGGGLAIAIIISIALAAAGLGVWLGMKKRE